VLRQDRVVAARQRQHADGDRLQCTVRDNCQPLTGFGRERGTEKHLAQAARGGSVVLTRGYQLHRLAHGRFNLRPGR